MWASSSLPYIMPNEGYILIMFIECTNVMLGLPWSLHMDTKHQYSKRASQSIGLGVNYNLCVQNHVAFTPLNLRKMYLLVSIFHYIINKTHFTLHNISQLYCLCTTRCVRDSSIITILLSCEKRTCLKNANPFSSLSSIKPSQLVHGYNGEAKMVPVRIATTMQKRLNIACGLVRMQIWFVKELYAFWRLAAWKAQFHLVMLYGGLHKRMHGCVESKTPP